MKSIFKFICVLIAFSSLQSCDKNDIEGERIIDNFTYATKFDWRENSIKSGDGTWVKAENGNIFSWLLDSDTTLITPNGFATYNDRKNIRTDFIYTIEKDSVFSYRISSDTVYFLDANGNKRTDIYGQITTTPDTSLILHNMSVSPNISIRYRPE